MGLNNKMSVEIPIHILETNDYNKIFGYAIRVLREWFKDLDPNILPFGDDTPKSTIEMQEALSLDKKMFHYHFKKFKEFTKKEFNREVLPIIQLQKNVWVYKKSDVDDFTNYLRLKKNM